MNQVYKNIFLRFLLETLVVVVVDDDEQFSLFIELSKRLFLFGQ
jgi:hypothetical protein